MGQALCAGRGIGVILLGLYAVHHPHAAALCEHLGQIAGGLVREGLHTNAHFRVQLCHGALPLRGAATGLDGGVRFLIELVVHIALAQQLGLELHIVGHRHDLFQGVLAHLGILHHGFQQVQVVVFLVFHTKNPPSGLSLRQKGDFIRWFYSARI